MSLNKCPIHYVGQLLKGKTFYLESNLSRPKCSFAIVEMVQDILRSTWIKDSGLLSLSNNFIAIKLRKPAKLSHGKSTVENEASEK